MSETSENVVKVQKAKQVAAPGRMKALEVITNPEPYPHQRTEGTEEVMIIEESEEEVTIDEEEAFQPDFRGSSPHGHHASQETLKDVI